MLSRTGPFFTAKARAAAAISRERRKTAKKPPDALEVFVARDRDDQGFIWEFRKFGGIVMTSSAEKFASIGAARVAGIRALRAELPD